MAIDSWMPHRFSQLSDRLVTQDGILMMGLAAFAALLYTRGDVTTLVVMYSINVFITFSLSLLGMSRHWIQGQREEVAQSRLASTASAFSCVSAFSAVTVFEKFAQGGWITIVDHRVLVLLCLRHPPPLRARARRPAIARRYSDHRPPSNRARRDAAAARHERCRRP